MMRYNILALLCALLLVVGCTKDEDRSESAKEEARVWHEYTVAVVLPMEDGMGDHWWRTLHWASDNLQRAFVNQKEGIRLTFEWYDESSEDLVALTKSLCKRSEIIAVIGGMESDNAAIMAPMLTRHEKVFMSLATSSDLMRAYTNTSFWAMTESDITECEILLSKVIN